jgi:CRISPR-associated protein Cmr1
VQSLTFRLQVVTPLFLSGADQQVVELRPPSIRGALRFWFRAMMGGVVGGDWQKVKQLEDGVFGSTEGASRFRVTISWEPQELNIFDPTQQTRYETRDGLVYLSFPRLGWDSNVKKHRWIKPHIEPDSVFTLQLRFFDDSSSTQQLLIASLWLLLHCGGLGARSRRGFGSLRCLSPPSALNLSLHLPTDPQQLGRHFKEGLQRIQQVFSRYALSRGISSSQLSDIFSTARASVPSFSCFHHWEAALITKDSWTSWNSVLDDMGQFLRRFRNNSLPSGSLRAQTPDYTNVVTYYLPTQIGGTWHLQHARVSSWDLQNDAFGLPIQYRSNSRSRQVSTQNQRFDISAIVKWRLGSEEHDRRGSPLIIRPLSLGNGQYAVILLILKSEFLPEGAVEYLQATGKWPPPAMVPRPRTQTISTANLGILSKFFAEAKKAFTDLGGLP